MKKKILIIGGSSGLGLELAKNFLQIDYDVIIASSKKKNFINSKKSLYKISSNFSFLKCNLKIDKDVNKLLRFINKYKASLDCVVLSSGEGIIGSPGDINSTVIRDYIKAFVFSYIKIINCLTDNKNINPNIIYISSYVAHFYTYNLSLYSYVKKTIDNFLRLLSKEYLGNILIVYPGSLNTKFDKKTKNYSRSKKMLIKTRLSTKKISIKILESYKTKKKFYYSNFYFLILIIFKNLIKNIVNSVLNFFNR